MSGVNRFVKKKDEKPRNNPFGNVNHVADDAVIKPAFRAKDLYAKVPKTSLDANPESNVSDLSGLAKALAARYPLVSDSELGSVSKIPQRRNVTDLKQQKKSKFDDTELEDSTISSIEGILQEQPYGVRNGHVQSSPKLLSAGNFNDYEQQYGPPEEKEEGHNHFKKEEDERYHQNDVHFGDPVNVEAGPAFWDEIGEARRDPSNARYLQAQSLPVPSFIQNPSPVRSPSPVPYRQRPTSRPRPSQSSIMAPPAKPTKSTVVIPPPAPVNSAQITATFDKTSSYTDSSGNTTPPPLFPPTNSRDKTNKKKRPHSDLLDHDPATLKSVSFSDLDKEFFDLDPRHPSSTSTTTSSTHLEKLSTLRSLSESERAKFFASQTKDQWTASTEFFEKRLGELFQELRGAREKRRDVALRFEAEVRERWGAVREGGEGIESALAEIRGKARGVLPVGGKSGAGR
ncbi:hypothetical protein EPUS_01920 [Endocarpon pusillum Z07020]|uniref:Extracellular mutant protein 11 C-terminal domain-containing protein n=1 Tax=Endocarpon pusillum (strain Z07020 / HMAS-L-300199) TaxID=1263415 RepID=U1HHF6_ENDPU|nr:uncharacterized protein EPUS_01920 [Endocarpon pusillum Z07020]ERF69590.1 hypothetical protein EPUS_01920 [Endocarpon pusillum Z07020]